MKTSYFILAAAIIFSYFIGYNEGYKYSEDPTIVSFIQNVSGGQVCIRYLNVTVVETIPNYVNITHVLNITESQKKQILNLKPKKCFNIGCSEGYIKCKYDFFDIMGYPHPKFSEKPSSGFNQVDNRSYLPVENDGFGEYIKITDDWYIWEGQQLFNLSFLCYGNNSWTVNYERTDDGYYNINKTYTFNNLSFGNGSLWFPAQGNQQIYLRHV